MPKLLTRSTPWLLFIIGTLAMTFDLTVPSFWQDEAATISGAERPIPMLLQMATKIDVVHSFYYGLMHFWTGLFGFTVFWVRFPSALAVGLTSALIYLLVRRLNDRYSIAIWAALIYLAIPRTHFASSESRSNALTATLAVGLTLALVWAVQTKLNPWLVWLAYFAIATFATYLFMFSALMIAPHVIYLLVKNRKRIWYFAGAWALAFIAASPLLYWGYHEKNQVSWIKIKPILTYLSEALFGVNFMEHRELTVIVLALAALAVFFYVRNRRQGQVTDSITALAAIWAFLPPFLLIAASFAVHPYFVDHYLTFTTPAMAILGSAGLHRLRFKWATIGVGLLILVLGFFSLQVSRGARSHGPEMMPIIQDIATNTAPGDGLLLPDWRTRNSAELQIMGDAYRLGYLPGRIDLALVEPPTKSKELFGKHVKENQAPQPAKLMQTIVVVTDVVDKTAITDQIPAWVAQAYQLDHVTKFRDANLTYFKLKQ